MAIPKIVSSMAAEARVRIAARDAEIAQLEKALDELKAQRAAERVNLIELEENFPELVMKEEPF